MKHECKDWKYEYLLLLLRKRAFYQDGKKYSNFKSKVLRFFLHYTLNITILYNIPIIINTFMTRGA